MAAPVTVESLLSGCCHEGERAHRVAILLSGLRNALSANYHVHMDALITECRRTGQKLHEFADTCQLRKRQVPLIINYLNLILPCIGRSLRDMTAYYEDKTRTKEVRWQRLYHKMGEEMPRTNITARFSTYCDFLDQLKHCITMAPQWNPNYLDILTQLVNALRSARGMDPPTPVQDVVIHHSSRDPFNSTEKHWVQAVFEDQVKFQYDLKKSKGTYSESKVFGPFYEVGKAPDPGPETRILSEHSFTQGRVKAIIYSEMPHSVPFMYLRITNEQGQGLVSIRGIHEVCVKRSNASGLLFTRWSKRHHQKVDWAELYFKTWEELVLFHSTFMVLKTYSYFTIDIDPLTYKLDREKCLFREKIIDNGYEHTLSVFQDKKTGGRRLQASIREPQMIRYSPIWTAFLTQNQVENGEHWIIRKASRRVMLRNIHPYIFSNIYKPKYSSEGFKGLEIRFSKEDASRKFSNLFGSTTETTLTTESSDATAKS